MKRSTRLIILGGLIATSFVLAALVLGDFLPYLRGPAPETNEWYWPYLLRPVGRWWPSLLFSVVMLVTAAWWFSRQGQRRVMTASALTLIILTSVALQLGIIYADRQDWAAELTDRTLSNLSGGFFEAAADTADVHNLLANYPEAMPAFVSEHARTHPPGLLLANWATVKLVAATPALADRIAEIIWPHRCTDLWLLNRPPAVAAALGIWSWLPLIAGALAILPGYALARRLLQERGARLATVLIATMPALLLFSPKSVQFYAPLTLLFFWLFIKGFDKRSWPLLLVSGFVLSGLTFLSLGNMSLVVLLALFVFLFWLATIEGQGMRNFGVQEAGQWIHLVLPFVLGAFTFWGILWLGWGTPPWAVVQTGLEQHYRLVTSVRRYDWWLLWDLVDLLLFAGWPLMLGFLGALLIRLRIWREREFRKIDVLAFSLLIFVLLLDFSGSARGEVGRIWLFFMPLLAYPSAYFWGKVSPKWQTAVLVAGMQLLLTLCLALSWRPVRAVIVTAERPTMSQAEPEERLMISFASEPITLSGFKIEPASPSAASEIDLTLFWAAGGAASRPYTVFTQLLNESGEIIAQQDNWPVQGEWPPTCWDNGDEIVDRYSLVLPPEIAPGDYSLVAGFYHAQTGERLLTADGRDFIDLKTLSIK